MFAVVETGGKQYKVAEGDTFRAEKIAGAAGDTIKLDNVLMVGDAKDVKVGAPMVSGASVAAEIVAQDRNEKIKVFKKKRRQNYRRTAGHRQEVTVLRVTGISAK